MLALDRALFFVINGQAGAWPWLDLLMITVDRALPPGLLLLLAALWLMPGRRRSERRIAAVLCALAILLALGLGQVPVYFHYRTRPFLEFAVKMLGMERPSPSFPSLHVASSAAVATALGTFSRTYARAAWAVTLLAVISRVYVGVHYPTDTLGGLLLGWLVGLFVAHLRAEFLAIARRVVGAVEALWPL